MTLDEIVAQLPAVLHDAGLRTLTNRMIEQPPLGDSSRNGASTLPAASG